MSMIDLNDPKLPPQNLEAEQSVLGAILLDNGAMSKAIEILQEEDFYRMAHRKVYSAMLDLADRGEVIDQITLTEHLKMRATLNRSAVPLTSPSSSMSCQARRMSVTTPRSSMKRRCFGD